MGPPAAMSVTPADRATTTPNVPYGIAPYVDRAVERIERYFHDDAAGEAFVVGVFGEWGSGKSTVLRAIRDRYQNAPEASATLASAAAPAPANSAAAAAPAPAAAAVGTADDPPPSPRSAVDRFRDRLRRWREAALGSASPGLEPATAAATPGTAAGTAPVTTLTLRIEFNAWRYEREEHLLVPLLKTIQRVVDDYVAALPKPSPWPGGAPNWEWLADRAQLLGACTIALTRVVKLKVGLPGFGEVELDGEGALKAAQAQIDRASALRAAAAPKPARPLESLYYDLNTELGRITRGVGPLDKSALNFVVLVDDLDRCLPEKAVEMLEAIKLFLDVQGCAFVLALDDEVIERGIAHRYRDYLKPTPGVRQPMPITGHEYLEKIVQLPFRLPRWSKREVREFLQTRFAPQLAHWNGPPVDTLERASLASTPDGWLVDLLVDGVPPVPRNLVRAVELLEFTRDVAIKRGLGQRLQAYPVAQMVLLQLFSPQCFRFLRRGHAEGWKTFERRLRSDDQEFSGASPEIAKQLSLRPSRLVGEFFAWWIKLCRIRLKEPTGDPYLSRTELPLAEQLDEARNNRNGFDPRNLFLLSRDTVEVDAQLEPYFSLFEEGQAAAAPLAAAVAAPVMAPAVPVQVGPTGPVAGLQPVSAPAPMPGAVPARVAAPAAAARPLASPVPLTPTPTPAPTPTPTPTPTPAPTTSTVPTTAAPRDREAFVQQLLSRSQDAWRNAITREEQLAGRTLDDRTFDDLLGRAGTTVREAVWLETVLPLLSESQLRQLVKQTRCLAQLAARAGLIDAPKEAVS
jgi:hypothetical protein